MRIFFWLLSALVVAGTASDYSVSIAGDGQHGRTNTILENPLSLTISDSPDGTCFSGIPIQFTMDSDNGSLSPVGFIGTDFTILESDTDTGEIFSVQVLTDNTGSAGVHLVLGDETGNNNVETLIFYPDEEVHSVRFSALALDLKMIIFQILGGLAIFLLGMRMMSDSLQAVAGDKMKSMLGKITDNRFLGIMVGALVTAVIQSSSATSVITVSFVNSGLMILRQAVGVIIGANIGTTITGQLIAFKITHYAYPIVTVGFMMMAFSKKRATQFWGRALLGLGLIFLGMMVMKQVLDPIKTSYAAMHFFTKFSESPFLAVLAGVALTSIIQSSSATVGLTMTLAGAGLLSLQGAAFLVLGDNIGTTITAQLSTIGSGRAAKQTAMAHTMFNVLGAVYFGLLISNNSGFLLNLVRSTSSDTLRQVANVHTMFNITNAIVFIPLVPMLTKICKKIIPDKTEKKPEEEKIKLMLDENLLDSPFLAIATIERELVKMAEYASNTVQLGMSHFLTGSPSGAKIMSMEDEVDCMQRDITIYASELFQHELDEKISLKLPVLLHSINDIERVSDHAVNMVEARELISGNLLDSPKELARITRDVSDTVKQMFDATVESLRTTKRTALEKVLALEAQLNMLDDKARSAYSAELKGAGRGDFTELAMLDYVSYCERIGDHLTNIAQSILGGGIWHGTDDIH